MIKILIVDDQKLFAESLRTVLEGTQDDFSVCAIAEDGAQAIVAVAEHLPSIVLMDVRMPVMDGVAASRIIHSRYPEIPILMLTTFEDDEYVREALGYGVKGYLLKNIPSQELVASIRAVLSGALLLDPRLIGALVGRGRDEASPKPPASHPEWFDVLSRRERQILGLMIEGYQNDEIAQRLCVAQQTVRNYISRIYDKTVTEDRVQVIRLARASGLF
ncbi:MAG: response regulator transcription factor [Spirochaetes bacterium]|nr:response regulator transcription factor [Spirochaetota bacterium]MBU1081140.1 response regulator transcription factor [Spirochaetota bacterium]